MMDSRSGDRRWKIKGRSCTDVNVAKRLTRLAKVYYEY